VIKPVEPSYCYNEGGSITLNVINNTIIVKGETSVNATYGISVPTIATYETNVSNVT
jgi:hypothetical protein